MPLWNLRWTFVCSSEYNGALLQEELDYAPEWITKARYRRGQAHNGKQNFDLALRDLMVVQVRQYCPLIGPHDLDTDLSLVQRLQPEDAGVKKEIAVLKKAMQVHKDKEKKMYGKMFG